MRNYRTFLEDIVTSISKIERFTKDLDYKAFQSNELVIDAVLRNLELIGEAARRLPDEIKEKNKDIPWKRLIGLRNIVIHEYFGVDLEIIWKIAKENLPYTKSRILKLLNSF